MTLTLEIPDLRQEIIGNRYVFRSPFGDRLLTYADYTASGRTLRFIEQYLVRVQQMYANTHTEDDVTGRGMTGLLHQAEERIKDLVNAGPDGAVITVGTGTTGAIHHLQKILGVYVPPALGALIRELLGPFIATRGPEIGGCVQELGRYLEEYRPIVFVGPMEHHSNEVSWRECFAEVRQIGIDARGLVDLQDLERQVSRDKDQGRLRIGSFSAASNVTGVRSPVHDIARLLRRNGVVAAFDYAAAAPYVEMDMNRDPESAIDALFFSPHKFLGGPGSSGVLVINQNIYRSELPPTMAAGGTVTYVSSVGQDYAASIEERERAGTPGVLQVLKAALAMEVKDAVGLDVIEGIDADYARIALERLTAHPRIEILGPADPKLRLPIISFNVKTDDGYLHPKLVTRLLNDLFGIQSRAGCSCAGPYGHHLLGIGLKQSEEYRCEIGRGFEGIKPGWVRISLHYVMEPETVDFILSAIETIADAGPAWLELYEFDVNTGAWEHHDDVLGGEPFGLEPALESTSPHTEQVDLDVTMEYRRYLQEARQIAAEQNIGSDPERQRLPEPIERLRYFEVKRVANASD